jgi:pimeloyl-ACP methyl ester carboxylesterase
MYAIEHPTQVDHLILYGAMYSASLPKSAQELFLKPYTDNNGAFNNNLPAYQNIPWKIIQTHWQMMTDENTTIVSQEALDTVGKTYVSIDKHPMEKDTLRRPMGPMKDLFLIWHNQPLYPINKIATPTLVIYGNQDIFADKHLFSQLTGVTNKKEVEVKEATHWLIYEKTRSQFYNEVISFIKNE